MILKTFKLQNVRYFEAKCLLRASAKCGLKGGAVLADLLLTAQV